MNRRTAFTVALYFMTGCASPSPVLLPPAEQVASLEVSRRVETRLVDVSETTERAMIQRALDALGDLNTDWATPWDTFPTPDYTASFHSSAGGVLVVWWIGDSWLGAASLDEMPQGKRLRSLTAAQRSALLRALGIP